MSTREIHLGWDTELGGMRRLTAKCADEMTSMIFMGPSTFDESDMKTLLAGEFGRMAVEEHRGLCEACQAWAARPAS